MNAGETRTGQGAEIWFVDVDRVGPSLLAFESEQPRLSADERARASDLGIRAEAWQAFRVALRLVLERHVGARLRGQSFAKTARGKPRIPWATDLDFSLSHSGPLGLLAVAHGPVGVDIERVREVTFPGPRRAAIIAAAVVVAGNASGTSQGADSSPLQSWVRLEAWAKARGSGIGGVLSDLGIWGADPAVAAGLDPAQRTAGLLNQEDLAVLDLDLPKDALGAIALPRGFAIPHVRSFPASRDDLIRLAAGDDDAPLPLRGQDG